MRLIVWLLTVADGILIGDNFAAFSVTFVSGFWARVAMTLFFRIIDEIEPRCEG